MIKIMLAALSIGFRASGFTSRAAIENSRLSLVFAGSRLLFFVRVWYGARGGKCSTALNSST